MVGRLRDAVGDVEQKDAEAEKDDDADLDLLLRRTEEDGQKQHRRQDRRQDDVQDVERVPSKDPTKVGHITAVIVRNGNRIFNPLFAVGRSIGPTHSADG